MCALIGITAMATLVLRTGGVFRGNTPYRQLAPTSFLPVRGKKQQKSAAKAKKKEDMKEYLKQLELKMVREEAAMRAAKHGEPLDPEVLNPARKRPRPAISEEESERRVLLVKEYTRHKMERHKQEMGLLQGMMAARRKALNELRKISFPLYSQALELSSDVFPFSHSGPTATPPIPGYIPPDLED